jgi:hypothetical protein
MAAMQDRMRTLNCVDIVNNNCTTVSSEPEPGTSSDGQQASKKDIPLVTLHLVSSLENSDESQQTSPVTRLSITRRHYNDDDLETQSDTECMQWLSPWNQAEADMYANTDNNITVIILYRHGSGSGKRT